MERFFSLLISALLVFTLTSCSTSNAAESNDPFLRKGIGMSIAAANYVNRGVLFRLDNGNNGGGHASQGSSEKPGSSGSMCCFTITDLKKPVKVELNWSSVSEPLVMGPNGSFLESKVLIPAVKKEIVVSLPQRLPHIIPNDNINSENVMCVIIKSLDTVELKYSDSYDCEGK